MPCMWVKEAGCFRLSVAVPRALAMSYSSGSSYCCLDFSLRFLQGGVYFLYRV